MEVCKESYIFSVFFVDPNDVYDAYFDSDEMAISIPQTILEIIELRL